MPHFAAFFYLCGTPYWRQGMKSQVHQGCSMGDLIITAIQRGGDRDAFVLADLHITWRPISR